MGEGGRANYDPSRQVYLGLDSGKPYVVSYNARLAAKGKGTLGTARPQGKLRFLPMLGSTKDHHISIDLGFLLIGIIVSASVENSL